MPACGLRAIVVAVAISASGGAASFAQDRITVPSPLLTLDQEKMFDGSRAAERISANFEKRTAALTAENRRIEAQLVAEELDLTDRRPGLAADEFRALADAFDEKVQRIRAAQDAKVRELQRLQDQERQEFLRTISPLLAEIVRERGAVVVLDRRSVVLSADAIDITAEAIARINASIENSAGQPGVSEPGLPEDPDVVVTPDQN